MGRSVSVATNSAWVAYSHVDADDWTWYCEDFQRELIEALPSLSRCSSWVGREDHALVENRYACIGVSEYCGVVSMWVQPKDGEHDALRDHWIDQIEATFFKVCRRCFGQPLRKLGTFSNGEAVFSAIK